MQKGLYAPGDPWHGRAMRMFSDLYISRGPAAAFVAQGLVWGAFGALVPEVMAQAQLEDAQFGRGMLLAALAALVAMWLTPWIDAQLGRWSVPVLSVSMGLLFLLPGVASAPWMFMLFMPLATAASGSQDVAMNARVSVLEGETRRSLMNLNHGIFSVAYAGSALMAGLLRAVGWSPIAIYTVIAVMIALLTVQVVAAPVLDPPEDADAPPGPRRVAWALVVPGGLIVLAAYMSEQATEGWSALHLERGFDAGAAQAALGPTILGVTMAVGRLSGQAIVHRVSEAGVIRYAAVLGGAGAALAAWAQNLPMAYLGFGMLGLGVSVIGPMGLAWVGRMVPNRDKALAISRMNVLGYSGFFIGPPAMAALSEGYSLSASFTAVALVFVMIPAVFLPWMQRQARIAADHAG